MDIKKISSLSEEEKKRLFKNLKIFAVLAVIAIAVLFVPNFFHKDEEKRAEFSAVDKICELATLRCYYHDVAEYVKTPDGLFKYGFGQYGYKKMYIEYNGIVEIGIKVGEVKVGEPDKNGIVKIYVPQAEILNVDADKKSMSDPIIETGILTTITTEEKASAFSDAQATMRANTEADASIMNQAHNNAKELLKQYIVNAGKQIGVKYTVEWVGNSNAETVQKEITP